MVLLPEELLLDEEVLLDEELLLDDGLVVDAGPVVEEGDDARRPAGGGVQVRHQDEVGEAVHVDESLCELVGDLDHSGDARGGDRLQGHAHQLAMGRADDPDRPEGDAHRRSATAAPNVRAAAT